MFDLKVIHSVLDQLEQERGIPRERIIEAIESALATAYKKEYGKRGQIIRATFDLSSGKADFFQVKIVVDESRVIISKEGEEESIDPNDERVRFSSEHHIMLDDARMIKKDAKLDEEVVFPLETQTDYGRIAAQTAKQVIIQKIREAEKVSVMNEFGKREGEIIVGTVQRQERGSVYIDMGRAIGVLPYEEQIPGERLKQGERVRAYLARVEESVRGIFVRLSRSHPQFLAKLFEAEVPEIKSGSVVIKSIAREAGSRSKIAVSSTDSHIDPVGSMVGQRGVRVSTVMSELGGEKIDIIEWSESIDQFVQDSLSPAEVVSVSWNEAEKKMDVTVIEDQQSLAIGKGGQNVRLAAKLTGVRIDIKSIKGASENLDDTVDEEVVEEIIEQPAETSNTATAEVESSNNE